LRFSPDYRSTGVFPGESWKSTKPAWAGESLSPEEALFVWESYGKDGHASCTDKDRFIELMSRKDTMNLAISMWKEGIGDVMRYNGYLQRSFIITTILELMEVHPLEWLDKIGIVDLLDLRNWVDAGNYKYFTVS
jgi:hypothetical protein